MSQPRFSALEQQDDDTHEMLTLPRPSTTSNTSSKAPPHSPSPFSSKWSPFPYRITLTLLLLPLSLAPIISLSAAAESTSQTYIRGRSCYPNGLWKYATDATWEIMDSSYFFTPNLSFGNMTFTQVKVIDIAWDLLVGRGGQVLMAWVNYRVFNEWVVWLMEGDVLGFKMYAAVAFETTTVGTLGVLGKEIIAKQRGVGWMKGGLRWLAVVSMFLSTLYVLSFPTLLAAMTGYIAKSEPYVEDDDRNLIAWGKVDTVRYVVNDAARIGFEKPLVVGRNDGELVAAMNEYIKSINLADEVTLRIPGTDIYFYEQKLLSQLNITSTWNLNNNPTNLASPTLNITLYPVNIETDYDMTSSSILQYSISGRQSPLYNTSYMLSHSSCKPGETYQWGFSYIFLFMVSIFNFIWSCIMVGMWFDTRRGSRAYHRGRRPGLLRSIVEYAAALREEIGEELVDMEEDEIRARLRRGSAGLKVLDREVRVRRVDTGGGGEDMRKRSWKSSLTRGSTF